VTGAGQKYAGLWAFLGAAAAAPIAYLSMAPCGLACGGCPLGGACFVPTPLVLGAVVIGKLAQKKLGKGATEDEVFDLEDSEDDDFE
jgi:hypothetical protein